MHAKESEGLPNRRRKCVAAFLVLTFVPAWLIWEGAIQLGLGTKPTLFALLVLVGAFAPAIAAIIIRNWVEQEGFEDAGLTLHFSKWRYYVAAILVPIAVVGFIVIAAPALGIGRPSFGPAKGQPIRLVVAQLIIVSVLATPILWGEEFGWRSYLQLRIFPNRPLLAAIATGVIWGVWHYPLLIAAPELPLHPWLTLALFPVGTVLYSIIFGWLRIRSGSVWVSSLCHSAFNNFRSPLVAILFASQHDMLPIAVLGIVAFAIIATAVVALDGLRAQPHCAV